MQAGRAASQAAKSARPLARRLTKAVGLPKLIGAAVIGGTLVYFLDPVKGSERRQRLLSAWQEKRHSMLEAGRQAARQTAKAVKPQAGRVSDQVADAVEGVKSKVR